MSNLVAPSSYVILEFADSRRFFAFVDASETTKIGKASIPTSPLIGLPYGSVVEVNGRSLFRVEDDDIEPDLSEGGLDFRGSQKRDNRNVSTSEAESSQNLSTDDIQQMRNDGRLHGR